LARFQRADALVLGFSGSVQRHLDGAELIPHAQGSDSESRVVSVSFEAGEVSEPNRLEHAYFLLLVESIYDADTPTGA
jgi:hypothetical protein